MPYVQPNLVLNTAIAALIQTDALTDPVPDPATNAFLMHTEVNPVALDAKRISVQHISGSFTKQGDIIGRKLYKINPQFHLQGSGAGTKPFYIDALEACGHVVTSGGAAGSSSWLLKPTTFPRTLAMYHYAADIRRRILGALGTATFTLTAGDVANVQLQMLGRYEKPANLTFPTTLVLPNPRARLCENEGLTLGSYVPRAKVITFTLDEKTNEREDLNSSDGLYGIYIGDREPMVDIEFEANPTLGAISSTDIDPFDILASQTYLDIGWTHGYAGGSFGGTQQFSISQAQLVELSETETNRRRLYKGKWKLRNTTPNGEYSMLFKESLT